MPTHRSNKGPPLNGSRIDAAWFNRKNERERARKKIAKASKRRNR